MASGGADATVCIWDAMELVCVRTVRRLDLAVRALSFSHDGRYLASGSEEFKIDIV